MLAEIVAQAPIYAAAHVLRATALEAAGLVDAALVSWGRAAALVPRSPLVHRERERLLATRLSGEPPLDLPPAEPAPQPEPPAPHVEPPASVDAPAPPAEAPVGPPASAPEGPYGAPQTLDISDLMFTEAPTPPDPAASRPTREVPDPLPEAEPPVHAPPPAEAAPPPIDWASVPPPQAAILPPEGDLPPVSSLPSLEDESGWGVLDEIDVPTPPPGTYAEPDVIAPETKDRPTVADDLDDLISQLEVAPRIRPDPEFEGPDVPLDTGDVDDLASETLAKIYAAQHQYVEAALVYEKLAARQPDQADELLERAAELRNKQ